MRFLLDTHVFLWVNMPGKLSVAAKTAFLDPQNDLYLSPASYWEICIKVSVEKLVLSDDWPQILDREMTANNIQWLPLTKGHCQQVIHLPFLHRDPFDRLLIAQALYEGMTLITSDAQIHQYHVSSLW